jgi:hypothetical protein
MDLEVALMLIIFMYFPAIDVPVGNLTILMSSCPAGTVAAGNNTGGDPLHPKDVSLSTLIQI